MRPKFTRLELLLTMLDSTRLAITMRDVAGPQVSPAVVQSESFAHLVSAIRHMPVEPPDVVILQVSPALPAWQEFVAPTLQVLAGPTHALVSTQGLLACTTLHG